MLIEVGFSGGQRGGGARLRWQCPGLVEGLWENGFAPHRSQRAACRAVWGGGERERAGGAMDWQALGSWVAGATHPATEDCAGGTHEPRHIWGRAVFSRHLLSTLFSESTPTLHLPPQAIGV